MSADKHHDDVTYIQQNRGGGGRAESFVDLQNRAQERRTADQQHVRQHDRSQAKREEPIRPHVGLEIKPGENHDFANDRQSKQDQREEIYARLRELIGIRNVGWALPTAMVGWWAKPTLH